MIAIFHDDDTIKPPERVLNNIVDNYRFVWPGSHTSEEFNGQIPYQRGVKPYLDNSLSIFMIFSLF